MYRLLEFAIYTLCMWASIIYMVYGPESTTYLSLSFLCISYCNLFSYKLCTFLSTVQRFHQLLLTVLIFIILFALLTCINCYWIPTFFLMLFHFPFSMNFNSSWQLLEKMLKQKYCFVWDKNKRITLHSQKWMHW